MQNFLKLYTMLYSCRKCLLLEAIYRRRFDLIFNKVATFSFGLHNFTALYNISKYIMQRYRRLCCIMWQNHTYHRPIILGGDNDTKMCKNGTNYA